MNITLMLTCLCDALYGEVGIATVKVLEYVGCEIQFLERQTCCGQPPFNSGDWKESKRVAEQWLKVFSESNGPIVTPSASCAAMVRHGFSMLSIPRVSRKVFELSEFLYDELRIRAWPGLTNRQVAAYHRACHGRMLGLANQQNELLRMIGNLEIVEINNPEQCCGFGGAFSITHGSISAGIGMEKLESFRSAQVETFITGDMGCAMHLDGLARHYGMNISSKHFVQLLAEAL